ncbi:40S ribosomal protein S6, partial [Borealophlyctis nickersoniae]
MVLLFREFTLGGSADRAAFLRFCRLQLNFAHPGTGAQKMIEVDDERKYRIFYDKRMGAEVTADSLGDEFKGYVFKIT